MIGLGFLAVGLMWLVLGFFLALKLPLGGKRHLTRWSSPLLAAAALSACSGETWKEEALQPDGSVIIVTRTVERGGRHEIGQEPPIKAQSIEFTLPDTGQAVKWTDVVSEDLGSANFLPKLAGVMNGKAYVMAAPMGCLSYNKWGRPNPPYVVFQHKGSSWQQVSLSELPMAFKAPNLVPSNPDVEAKKTGELPVSAKTIANIVAEYQQPELKTILRERMINPPCPPVAGGPKAPLPIP